MKTSRLHAFVTRRAFRREFQLALRRGPGVMLVLVDLQTIAGITGSTYTQFAS
jgi:hypothetical protein